VPILVSGPFQRLCSEPIKKYLREVDKVTVKGSILPIEMFTVDVDFEGLEEQLDRFASMTAKEKKALRDQEKRHI